MSEANSRLVKVGNAVLILVFLGLLWTPLCARYFSWGGGAQLQEKRTLAARPVLAWATLAQWPAAFDRYYADRFGLRDWLVQAHSNLEWKALGVSPTDRVCFGRNDWLFYAAENEIEDYQGTHLLTPEELSRWQALLEGKQAWLQARGIRYLFVVPPNKGAIYPEFLPSWVKRAPDATTPLDQLGAHLRAHSRVEILDLRQALLEAKKERAVYAPNDLHWTDYGGFVGYRQICRRLQQWFPDLRPLQIGDYHSVQFDYPGDLCLMLGMTRGPAPWELLLPRVPGAQATACAAPSFGTLPPMMFANPPEAFENPKGRRRLLVFRDSFMNHAPMVSLAENFRHSVFIEVWPGPDFQALRSMVEQERPDVVVEECLERKLRYVNVIPDHPEFVLARSAESKVLR